MTQEAKIILTIGIVTSLLVLGAIFFLGKNVQSPKQINNEVVADKSILIPGDSYQTASSSAKVNIVEFADFQCPACKIFYPVIKQALKDYPNDLNLFYRHYPLMQHKFGEFSAQAAEAAGKQGKFWQMYDKLYENQDTWSLEQNPQGLFEGYAVELSLNMDQFKKDLSDSALKQKILRDISDGNKLKVNSTPTIFINGIKYPGAMSYEKLKGIIEQNLNN